ncbi:hypothetical protein PVAND_011467 [Polypedilum vanderplanki]|uniref:Uncharacterized protein n=1 Tax=Polypedilum vanderplanki TaxID=319348 RepID=A0A9J6CKH5_POLVA|nr:hypothetical protein PVAND_011467 [Polypedilum vanderplanki]
MLIIIPKDELIIAKEHFAEIGDDLDFTFVDLIDGIDPIWSYRRPKPPTPPPKEPSPPKIIEAAAIAVDNASAVEGAPVAISTEGGEAVEPAVPKEPSPFELKKHFPADAAEVPFVQSHESIANTPKPSVEPEAQSSVTEEEVPAVEETEPAAEETSAPVEAAEEPTPAE